MAYNSMVGRIRILKSTIWAMVFLFSSSGLAFAQQNYPEKFYETYAIVQQSLKNGQGYFEELMEIMKEAPGQYELIAQYWVHKALKENHEIIESKKDVFLRRSRPRMPNSAEEARLMSKDAGARFVEKEIVPILRFYMYDHWDEINKMIIEKYQHFFPDKPIKKLSKP